MKAALAQTHIIWENKKANLEQAQKYIESACNNNAQIIFFPEMSLTGFSMNTQLTAESELETLENIRAIAQKQHIAIGIGWVKRQNTLAENHYTVIDNKGEILSDYIKIHPFSYAKEDQYFQSGNRIGCFDYGAYRWSTFICYDLRFPELFQIASKEADIIVVPANWPQKREAHWRTLLQARAIENQCYILGINCTGEIGGLLYHGFTCCISPQGELLKCQNDTAGCLYIELDNDVKRIREEFPVKLDRKWEFYARHYREK